MPQCNSFYVYIILTHALQKFRARYIERISGKVSKEQKMYEVRWIKDINRKYIKPQREC